MPIDLPPPLWLKEQHHLVRDNGVITMTVFQPPKALKHNVFVHRLCVAVNPDRRIMARFRLEIAGLLPHQPYFPNMNSAVHIGIVFHLRRPNNHFTNSNRNNSVEQNFLKAKVGSKGDTDNMIKFVLDAGNTVLYEDDRQVTSIIANKIWHEDPTSQGTVTVALKLID